MAGPAALGRCLAARPLRARGVAHPGISAPRRSGLDAPGFTGRLHSAEDEARHLSPEGLAEVLEAVSAVVVRDILSHGDFATIYAPLEDAIPVASLG